MSLDETLKQAEHQLARGALEDGLQGAQAVLDRDPGNGAACNLVAIAAVLQGRAEVAVASALRAIALQPADARFHFTLGRAHKLAGNLARATAAYKQALALNPRFAEALVSLGIALKHGGDIDGAIAAYEEALVIQPQLAAAHANLAHARAARIESSALHTGDGAAAEPPADEVLEGMARAAALDPNNPVLQRNHGLLLLLARRHPEAADAFNRALGLDLHDLQSCLQLGACLRALGALDHARQIYQQWLGINPPAVPVMRALAGVLTLLGANDQAIEWAEKAAAMDPDPASFIGLCSAYQQARRLPEALAAGRRAVDLSGGRPEAYPLLLLSLNYVHEQPQAVFDLHIAYGHALARSVAALAWTRPQWQPLKPGEKLHVGYVSGDFARHSVAYFISALLERHDRSRFVVTCYHTLGWSDDVTGRFKALGHRWVDCHGLPDETLARRIRDDGIHVLVDLSGLTSNARTRVFALGAAPVQLGYLGYPTITGVQTMDGRISDSTIDRGDMPPTPHEHPLRLPRSMFCYRPDGAPEIGPPPALRTGCITFGSFNNTAKLSDHALQLWARVMRGVAGSRLLLKSGSMAQPSTREGVIRLLATQGIAQDRLTLLAQTPDKDHHLALYNDVDIALDTYPYNGATTTCEALWMGVPVVTLKGQTHTSRMGASILAAAGRRTWVASTEDGFSDIATGLAGDETTRSEWRSQARQRLRASELLDEAGFTRSFEDMLQTAWTRSGPRTSHPDAGWPPV